MEALSRRRFLATAAALTLPDLTFAQLRGERPVQDAGVQVINPAGRVPVSLIIDDSTCLVNLAHYAMPQFAAAWPQRQDYQKPWWTWPKEIPDAFVRRFGEWCAERNVKGKYSIVPQPACVGWVDRELPGWSSQQLDQSLELVRSLMLPNWDIHPEMATHTRVIDTRTGVPFRNAARSGWRTGPGPTANPWINSRIISRIPCRS